MSLRATLAYHLGNFFSGTPAEATVNPVKETNVLVAAKPVAAINPVIEAIKEKFDPENPIHTTHIQRYLNLFCKHRDELKDVNAKLGGVAVVIFACWLGNLNNYLTLMCFGVLAYVGKYQVKQGEKEQAFSKTLNELHQLYQWCKASDPSSKLVTDLADLIAPFVQPGFKGIPDKVSYFFDAAVKNAMMIKNGIVSQDESLLRGHLQLK